MSTTHISSQGQLILNCGGCWWFKNHIKALVLVTERPDERAPRSCPGFFFIYFALFSWYSRDLHFSLTFSAAKNTWKKHEKSECYQTAAITTKWVHKWPAHESQSDWASNRDLNWCTDKRSRWRVFGIQDILEGKGSLCKPLDFHKDFSITIYLSNFLQKSRSVVFTHKHPQADYDERYAIFHHTSSSCLE